MEIIRFADRKPRPWPNGGGTTRHIAGHPGDASLQDGERDWQVGIAEVTKAGDLPPLPGMERVLTVVEGELLLLAVDGAEHPLEKYRAFRFPGGVAASWSLPTGDVRYLNVITRLGAFKGFTSIIELSKKRAHPLFGGQLGILLQGQAAATEGTSEPEALDRYDAVTGSDNISPEVLGRGFLAVLSIDPVGDEPGPG